MRWSASLVVAALVAACAPVTERPGETVAVAAPATPMDDLLALLHAFAAADADTRSNLYIETVNALAHAPTVENRLRLALLQGWPGHAHSRPGDALRLADSVLADETLDDGIQDLARVLRFWIAAHGVDQRRQRELQGRITALEAEIAELQRQLSELTEIERVIEPDR